MYFLEIKLSWPLIDNCSALVSSVTGNHYIRENFSLTSRAFTKIKHQPTLIWLNKRDKKWWDQ